MSEYIFPTVFSYTDGSGSGSGPEDTVPCTNCGFSAGTNVDTHYIDLAARVPADAPEDEACCPVLPREINENIVSVPENETIAMQLPPDGIIHKKGLGTLVITPYVPSEPNFPRWFCKVLTIEEGTVIVADPGAFPLGGDCDLTFGPAKLVGLDYGPPPVLKNLGTNTLFFNSIDFGTGWELHSYTSTPVYNGRIDLALGKINVAQDGISPTDLRAMLISGRNNGSWDGQIGITTSQSINTIKSIGYANLLAGGVTTIGWAAPGDTNLDGLIDILDIANILSSNKYDSGMAANWFEGDFNYDGVVDVLDVSTFKSSGLYNADNYFPQDTSFTIVWRPKNIVHCPEMNRTEISVSTNNRQVQTGSTIRAQTVPFVSPTTGREVALACEILTKLQCNGKASSVFVPGGNCNDNSCTNHALPSVRSGACCVGNACELVSDRPESTAQSYCNNVIKGTWKGYGSICADQTCLGNKIITIPTTPVANPNQPTWGGCCIPGSAMNTPRFKNVCVRLYNRPDTISSTSTGAGTNTSIIPGATALEQCSQRGGDFAGYGLDCGPLCNEVFL